LVDQDPFFQERGQLDCLNRDLVTGWRRIRVEPIQHGPQFERVPGYWRQVVTVPQDPKPNVETPVVIDVVNEWRVVQQQQPEPPRGQQQVMFIGREPLENPRQPVVRGTEQPVSVHRTYGTVIGMTEHLFAYGTHSGI
jgi:hypothetical protein